MGRGRRKGRKGPPEQLEPKRHRGPYKTWLASGKIPVTTQRYRENKEAKSPIVGRTVSRTRTREETGRGSKRPLVSNESVYHTCSQTEDVTTPSTLSQVVEYDTVNEALYERQGTNMVENLLEMETSECERVEVGLDDIAGVNEDANLLDKEASSEWEMIQDPSDDDNNADVNEDELDEEVDFTLRLDEGDETEVDTTAQLTFDTNSNTVLIQSDSESDDEDLPDGFDLHISVDQRIKLLLLLATKRRHKLTYTAAEDIMELAGVLSKEDNFYLPARYTMKKVIDKYSYALEEHHICPHCKKYVGIVTLEIFECEECNVDVNTKENKNNGNMFLYLPLRDQLKKLLETCLTEDDFINPDEREKIFKFNYEDIFDGRMYTFTTGQLSFNFFVDGVQISTTCKRSAWPVLVTINELHLHLRRKHVLMVSLWLSKKKPDCNEYLRPFVQECEELARDGLTFKKNGILKTVKTKPCCCISDSIARPLLRNSTQFNGRYGCGLCYHPGVKLRMGRGHARSYTMRNGVYPLRTHEELMRDAVTAEIRGTRQKGIKGRSILSYLPGFDMVHSIDLDLFHALVNVAKRFANLWFGKTKTPRAFNIRKKLSEVNNRLLSITPTSEVSRSPRPLEDRSDYRGHEWFYWVVVYSIPCLKNILSARFLNHWSNLVHGICIVMQNSASKCDVAYADRYLKLFVSGIDALYGAENVTFSCHLLTHLSSSVENFSQPWAHSAFIYESFNNEIKTCVKSSNGAALQICKEMQLKLAIMKLKEDVYDYMSDFQKQFLQKMLTVGKRLAAPYECIGSASFLGHPKFTSLPQQCVVAIVRFGGECNATTLVSIYDRCRVGGVEYQSVNYSKVSKQSNSLVLLECGRVFLIESFVVISSKCYVLGYFWEEQRNQKLCDITLPHYKILKTDHEGTLRCIGISQILSKFISISIQLSETEYLKLGCINVLQMEMLS